MLLQETTKTTWHRLERTVVIRGVATHSGDESVVVMCPKSTQGFTIVYQEHHHDSMRNCAGDGGKTNSLKGQYCHLNSPANYDHDEWQEVVRCFRRYTQKGFLPTQEGLETQECLTIQEPCEDHEGFDGDLIAFDASCFSIKEQPYCTVLAHKERSFATLEHALAACAALKIVGAYILFCKGNEMPILDGSASRFVELYRQAGLVALEHPVQIVEVLKPFHFIYDQCDIRIEPFDDWYVDVAMPLEVSTHRAFFYVHQTDEWVQARTFARLKVFEQMRATGFSKGASLENGFALDEQDQAINGFRCDNECARHKALDLIGDLLLWAPWIKGKITAKRPSHVATARLMQALMLQEPGQIWRWSSGCDHL